MAIIDTSYLYALINDRERQHTAVAASYEAVQTTYLPSLVIGEAAYLVQRDFGSVAVAAFINQLNADQITIIDPLWEDYQRAAAVIRQYHDSHIDLVDALIVAIAERLNITDILTLDRRHFRLFRPRHTTAFTLLP